MDGTEQMLHVLIPLKTAPSLLQLTLAEFVWLLEPECQLNLAPSVHLCSFFISYCPNEARPPNQSVLRTHIVFSVASNMRLQHTQMSKRSQNASVYNTVNTFIIEKKSNTAEGHMTQSFSGEMHSNSSHPSDVEGLLNVLLSI